MAAYRPEAFECTEPPVVVEHYPERGGLAERFDLVTFSSWRPRLDWLGGVQRVRLGTPAWRRLALEDLAALIGPVGEGAGRG